jgi:hypothetical protein
MIKKIENKLDNKKTYRRDTSGLFKILECRISDSLRNNFFFYNHVLKDDFMNSLKSEDVNFIQSHLGMLSHMIKYWKCYVWQLYMLVSGEYTSRCISQLERIDNEIIQTILDKKHDERRVRDGVDRIEEYKNRLGKKHNGTVNDIERFFEKVFNIRQEAVNEIVMHSLKHTTERTTRRGCLNAYLEPPICCPIMKTPMLKGIIMRKINEMEFSDGVDLGDFTCHRHREIIVANGWNMNNSDPYSFLLELLKLDLDMINLSSENVHAHIGQRIKNSMQERLYIEICDLECTFNESTEMVKTRKYNHDLDEPDRPMKRVKNFI